MKLPYNFWEWLFFGYSDSENYNTNYGRTNASAEYGISAEDFFNQYESEAIKDAKQYFESCDENRKKELIENWKASLLRKIEENQELLNNQYNF